MMGLRIEYTTGDGKMIVIHAERIVKQNDGIVTVKINSCHYSIIPEDWITDIWEVWVE